MSVRSTNEYTCPVHGEVQHADSTPPGWFFLENDVYCPSAAHEIASFLDDNPDASMQDAIASLLAA